LPRLMNSVCAIRMQMENQRESILETVTRSLTMLVINNRTNQDYIR
jgi:hypothetical protein